METNHTLLMVIGVLVIGCASPKATRYETMAYKSASPENRLRIEQGETHKMEIGLQQVLTNGAWYERCYGELKGARS